MIFAQAGLGTPSGLLGAWIEYDPAPYFALDVGVGVGASKTNPLQLAFMGRLRVPLGASALSIGAGLSQGGFEHHPYWTSESDPTENPPVYTWRSARWLNADIAFEHRADNWVQWRVFLGRGVLLNSGAADDCTTTHGDPCTRSSHPVSLLYVGFAAGYAFPP